MLNSLDWSQENFNQWQSSSPRDMQYIARDNRVGIISTTPSNTKSNEVLISGGFTYNVITSHGSRKIVPLTPEKYFLYDRKSQTARSLTPVTGSQDAFYDVSEPSTLLLRSDSHFTTEKPSIDLSDPSPHPTKTLSDNKTYIFLEGKWQLISQ